MKQPLTSEKFVFILLIASMILMAMMTKPLIHSFLFGAILAGSFYPLFSRFERAKGFNRNKAAIITTLTITIIIIIPSFFILKALSKESLVLYNNTRDLFLSDDFTRLLTTENRAYQTAAAFLEDAGVELDITFLKADILTYTQKLTGYILSVVNNLIPDIIDFFFRFIIMVLVIYSLFSQGDRLKAFIGKLSPLPEDQENLLLHNFNQMNYVTIVCNGLGGVLQGVLAGIGFWLAGVPSVVLWTVIMTFLAFIPLLGISIVFVPAVIYLAFTGKTLSAVILFIYCFLIALLVENWFKPIFIGQRIKINSLFVLFCIIGGMSYFGIAGIFYGPLIGIVFLTLVQLYQEKYPKA